MNNNYYSNKNRNNSPNIKKYTPNYVENNIVPIEYPANIKSSIADNEIIKKTNNKSLQHNMFNSTTPNLDNSNPPDFEKIKSNIRVSQNIYDDLSGLDISKSMIDNNDQIIFNDLTEDINGDINNDDKIINLCKTLSNDTYLLFFKNKPICSGDQKYVEDQIFDLILGTHELSSSIEDIMEEDILVIKKINFSIGASLK